MVGSDQSFFVIFITQGVLLTSVFLCNSLVYIELLNNRQHQNTPQIVSTRNVFLKKNINKQGMFAVTALFLSAFCPKFPS